VHLDATEHQDHVVFLHNIQEGPANRSFGLQVARLAGIPAAVLAAARDKLRELEQGAREPAAAASTSASPAQVDLFSAAPPHPVVRSLEELQPDDMTPRQALEKLYELKGQLD
jgi:DNA mismatch repair protein MutS